MPDHNQLLSNPTLDNVAFKLVCVEKQLTAFELKMDNAIQSLIREHPSREVLELMLKPYRDDIKDLQDWKTYLEHRHDQQRQQFRTILIAAVISPFASIVVAAIVSAIVMGMGFKP